MADALICKHCGRELYTTLTRGGWLLMSRARGNAYCNRPKGPDGLVRLGVDIHQIEMTPANVRAFLAAPDESYVPF